MNHLQENIAHIFGQKGKDWLQSLPVIMQQLATHWGLSNLIPLDNLSYHYVIKALKEPNTPVVIKVGCDLALTEQEIKTLRHFANHGCIQLLDVHSDLNALLLEQAIPGKPLNDIHPNTLDDYASVAKQLFSAPQPITNSFLPISHWLRALDNADDIIIPRELLNKAITLKKHLLQTADDNIILHGDLHRDNILQHRNKWIAIDPKGIVGERAFDVAAFDFITSFELENNNDIENLFKNRIHLLAHTLNLNEDRLRAWVFVRLILGAAWFLEDKGDPNKSINLSKKIFPLINNIYI